MFEGIVRGYRGYGTSGLGAVVVEVSPDAEIPAGSCFREIAGPVTRQSDGLEIARAVEFIGDWRPTRDIAEGLKDCPVWVTIAPDLGMLPRFELLEGDA